jgi:hypothetical protein
VGWYTVGTGDGVEVSLYLTVTFFDSTRLIIAILTITITRYGVCLSQIGRIVVVSVLL